MKFNYLFEVVFVDELPGQFALFVDFSPDHVQSEDDNIETQVHHFGVQYSISEGRSSAIYF
jgi:hypothetical protein